jgi:hypothetical protein
MTPSQRANDPVFKCKQDIRNRELHEKCRDDKNCKFVKECGKQVVKDKDGVSHTIDTLGSEKWPLGDASKWEEIKQNYTGDQNPEKIRAFRETNQCIRRILLNDETLNKEYENCNNKGTAAAPQVSKTTTALNTNNTSSKKPVNNATGAKKPASNAKNNAVAKKPTSPSKSGGGRNKTVGQKKKKPAVKK